MLLTRRKLAIGCGAFASSAILDARLTFGDPAPAGTHLPIPALIDAVKQGNADCPHFEWNDRYKPEHRPSLEYGL
jgi:hypothetical protein